jgi:hypothetical protein
MFGVSSPTFLGHLVDSNGIRPLSEKVEAICIFPKPTTQWKLREYLGLVNFYRRFLPGCAKFLLPLTSLLLGKMHPSPGPPQLCKASLAEATMLHHPHTDLYHTIGAVPQQLIVANRLLLQEVTTMQQRPGIAPLTGSSWQYTWPSDTSGILWRAENSIY